MNKLIVTVIPIALLMLGELNAQDESGKEDFRRNELSLALTHTFVPTAVNNKGDKTWLSLASWGLDYDYRINSLWGLGLHTDLVIQDFEYEDKGVVRKRTKPLAMAVVATRTLGDHITIFGGGGAEFSPDEETLGLFRLGADYGWELHDRWEVSFSLMTDFKIDAYNALVFGFAIGKAF